MTPFAALLSSLVYIYGISLSDNITVPDVMFPMFAIVMHVDKLTKAILWLYIKILVLSVGLIALLAFYKQDEMLNTILYRSLLVITYNYFIFTEKSELAIYDALLKLKVPKLISMQFFFFLKFLTIIKKEYKNISLSLKLKGFKKGPNTFTYKIMASNLVTIAVNALRKSDDFYQITKTRGFDKDLRLKYEYLDDFSATILFTAMFYIIIKLMEDWYL